MNSFGYLPKEKMSFQKLLENVRVLAIVCNQWGDTGKGKFSDYFAESWADVIARGTGGNNAGHTVVVNGKQRIFHLLPAGVVHDSRGKITILGNGMVIDVQDLIKELEDLESEGLTYDNLMISKDAHVVMPWHVSIDKAKNSSQKDGGIGSTGRGIGPCYVDKIARRGITIGDLFDLGLFKKNVEKIKSFYPEQEINTEKTVQEFHELGKEIKTYVKDTVSEMHKFHREGKKILLEGAQGLLLSIEHGTYPFVTSSDCSVNGTASGVGLSAKEVDLCLGIIKFPFMTRVGAGPFPTEFGGEESEKYCAEDGHRRPDEAKNYGNKVLQMINSKNDFEKGIGIRMIAGEYGATTGRPRRTGWTDAVSAKYARGINGPHFILTKVDSLAGADEFKICYSYGGETEFKKDHSFLKNAKPVYKTYKGYGSICNIREFEKLPESLKEAIADFEDFTGGKVAVVSVGPEREQTIVR
jgi:adenylosuccinate synthase